MSERSAERRLKHRPPKVSVIGAGMVGSTLAYSLVVERVVGEVVLVDVNQDRAQGEAKDIAPALPFSAPTLVTAGDYEACRNSDIVVITAGAIYRHFESMEAIVDAVVERMGSILFEDFPPEAANPIDRLRLFFRHRTRTILANPHLSRLPLSDHLSQAAGPGQAERLEEFKRRSQTFVIGCLQEAKQSGALSAEVSLAPSGFYQFYYAVRDGLWYARSPEITSGEVMRTLAWARIGPDLIFGAGALLLLALVGRAIWLSRGAQGLNRKGALHESHE